jgi:hypothetical protein
MNSLESARLSEEAQGSQAELVPMMVEVPPETQRKGHWSKSAIVPSHKRTDSIDFGG